MKNAKLMAMLIKLQSHVIDNDGIEDDVQHELDDKISEIMDKLAEGK